MEICNKFKIFFRPRNVGHLNLFDPLHITVLSDKEIISEFSMTRPVTTVSCILMPSWAKTLFSFSKSESFPGWISSPPYFWQVWLARLAVFLRETIRRHFVPDKTQSSGHSFSGPIATTVWTVVGFSVLGAMIRA